MPKKLNLTSQKILDEVFPGVPRGYDPLLVDQFLDKVIQDYLVVESNELIDKQEIDALREELADLKEENYRLAVENGKFKNRFENIKAGVEVTRDNMELIRKIDQYEKYLYSIGVDINEIFK